MDFFTVEVLTWNGLATYYVLFLIHLESRGVTIAGITRHPTETWMEQMARNVTDESTGCLRDLRYVLHDRDTKFCASFQSILTAAGVKPLKLPARSPNLNAFAERWVRLARQGCLSKLILFGEGSLKRAVAEFAAYFQAERPHQGKGNMVLFPTQGMPQTAGARTVCNSGPAAGFDITVVPHEFLRRRSGVASTFTCRCVDDSASSGLSRQLWCGGTAGRIGVLLPTRNLAWSGPSRAMIDRLFVRI